MVVFSKVASRPRAEKEWMIKRRVAGKASKAVIKAAGNKADKRAVGNKADKRAVGRTASHDKPTRGEFGGARLEACLEVSFHEND